MSMLKIGGLTTGGGADLGIRFDLQGVLAVNRNLGNLARRLPTIEKRAMGTLRRRLNTEARRDIQREYALPARRLSQDLSTRQTASGISVTGYFRGIGLRNFGARQTGAGVTAAVFRGQRTLRKGAFMAPLLGGGVHAVRREGEKRVMQRGRYVGQRRQPLAVEYGPTAAQMLRKSGRPERLADFARGVVGAEMLRLTDNALARANSP